MLAYEAALTRELPVPSSVSLPPTATSTSPDPSSTPSSGSASQPRRKAFFNTGAHFLWIAERTRQLSGAHVEMQAEELVRVLDVVNPDKESGRATLITRYGARMIDDHLPSHIRAVKESGHPVAWICDPMHGNTQTSVTGLKTRHFSNIISELTASLRIHTTCGSRLGGVNLEFTGEVNEEGYPVTECLGGSMESFCDPRLNFEQSLVQRGGDAVEPGTSNGLYQEFKSQGPKV
ncbi:hypothetical protein BDZ97DRAFT_1852092 [Flammula alnicola]|nr:hypothetical protein BDZ97DRAFT_1852092 [Flammula alnicola]